MFYSNIVCCRRSLLGTSQGPKTTDPVKKQEAGTGKTTTPPTPKKQEVAKGRTAATGTPNSKQASTAPGQGARSGDIGVARTVTPVRSTPTELGHRCAAATSAGARKCTRVLAMLQNVAIVHRQTAGLLGPTDLPCELVLVTLMARHATLAVGAEYQHRMPHP
jgi:hypothetical protein